MEKFLDRPDMETVSKSFPNFLHKWRYLIYTTFSGKETLSTRDPDRRPSSLLARPAVVVRYVPVCAINDFFDNELHRATSSPPPPTMSNQAQQESRGTNSTRCGINHRGMPHGLYGIRLRIDNKPPHPHHQLLLIVL